MALDIFKRRDDDDENLLSEALRRLQQQGGGQPAPKMQGFSSGGGPSYHGGGDHNVFDAPDVGDMTDPNHVAEQEEEETSGLPEDLTEFGQALGLLRRIREKNEQAQAQTPAAEEPEDEPTITLSGSQGPLMGSSTNRGAGAGMVDLSFDPMSGTITGQQMGGTFTGGVPGKEPEAGTSGKPAGMTPITNLQWTATGGLELQPLQGVDIGTNRGADKIRELTDKYNTVMGKIREGNVNDYLTEEDYDRLFEKYAAAAPEGTTYSETDPYWAKMLEELTGIANERAKAEAEALAANVPGVTDEYDLVYGTGHRPQQYVNPFSGTDKMQKDLDAANKMISMITPGTLNDQVNGELARQTAEEIQRQMGYVNDPDKALEAVRADLKELRALQELPQWAGNGDLQNRIWQQERQEQLLEAYITMKGASQEELDAAAKAQKEWEAQYEGTWGQVKKTGDILLGGFQGNTVFDAVVNGITWNAQNLAYLYGSMTQDEQTAYWLLFNQDPKKAEDYLGKLAADVNKRNYETLQAALYVGSKIAPVTTDVAGSLLATAVEPVKWVQGLGIVYRHLTGQEIDPYSGGNSLAVYQAAIRPAVKNDIMARVANAGGTEQWQYLAGEAYDLTENVLDNVFRNLTFGWANAPAWLSTAAMSVGTFGTSLLDMDQTTTGVSQEAMMLNATLRAVSEFATEALSDARFFNALKTGWGGDGSTWQRIGGAAMNVIMTSMIESGTEVLNDIDVEIFDSLVLHEEGNFNRAVESYYRQAVNGGQFGDDAEAAMEWATQMATTDTVNSLLHTLVFSAVSGGVMELTGRTMGGKQTTTQTNNGGDQSGAQGGNGQGDNGGQGGDTTQGGEAGGDQGRQDGTNENGDSGPGAGTNDTLSGAEADAAELGGWTAGDAQAAGEVEEASLGGREAEREAAGEPTGVTPGGQRLSGDALTEALQAEKDNRKAELDAMHAAGTLNDEMYQSWVQFLDVQYSAEQAAYRLQTEQGDTGLPAVDMARNPTMPKLTLPGQQTAQQGAETVTPAEETAPRVDEVTGSTEDALREAAAAAVDAENGGTQEQAPTGENAQQGDQEGQQNDAEGQNDEPGVLRDRDGNVIPEDAVGVDVTGHYYTSERALKKGLRQMRDEANKQLNQGLRDGSLTQEYVDAYRAMMDRMYTVDYCHEALEAARAEADARNRGQQAAPTLDQGRQNTQPGAEETGRTEETGTPEGSAEDALREAAAGAVDAENGGTREQGQGAQEGQQGAQEGQQNEEETQADEPGVLRDREGNVIPEDAVAVDVQGNYYTDDKDLKKALRKLRDDANKQLNQGLRDGSLTQEYVDAYRAMMDRMYTVDYCHEALDAARAEARTRGEAAPTLEQVAAQTVDTARTEGEETEGERTTQRAGEEEETGRTRQNGEEIVPQGENTAAREEGDEAEEIIAPTQRGEETEGEREPTEEMVFTVGNEGLEDLAAETVDGEHIQVTMDEESEGDRTEKGAEIVVVGENTADRAEGEEAEGERTQRAGEAAETGRTQNGEEIIPEGENTAEREEGAVTETVAKAQGRVTVDADGNRVIGDAPHALVDDGVIYTRDDGEQGNEGKRTNKENEETKKRTIVEAVDDPENAGVVLTVMEDGGLEDPADETTPADEDEETYTPPIGETEDETEDEETADGWWHPREGELIVDGQMYATVDQVTTQRQSARWIEGAYMAGRNGIEFNPNDMPASVRESGRTVDLADAAQRAYKVGEAERAAQQKDTDAQTEATARRLGYNYDRSGTQGKNGVNLVSVRGQVTESADAQLRVLDSFGQKYGMRFNVYDSLGSRNAVYAGGRTVSIALDADAGAIVKAASHEAYHYVQEFAPDAAADIRDFVLGKLQQTEGYDLTGRIQAVNDQYARSGQGNYDAMSEIVADSMIDALADGDTVTRAMTAKGYLTGTVAKIADHVQAVGRWLKSAVQQLAGHSPEVRALGSDAQYVSEVGARLQAAVQMATFNRRARADGGTYAAQDKTGIVSRFYDRIENRMRWSDSLRMMIDEVYEKVQKNAGKDTRNRTEARPEFIKALAEFTRGEKSLNKALEDHGFGSVDGADQDLTVWAARRLEQGAEGMAMESYTEDLASAHYDDFTDWILGTEGQFSWLDDVYTDFQARELINKLFTMTKQGIAWAGQQQPGTVKAGEWAPHLKGFVDALKSTTQTRMGVKALTDRIRSMYLALDNALLKGNDFSIGQALRYAQDIAEEITNRAGRRADTIVDDYITDFARSLRHSTIWLTEAQQDEAIRRYDSVQGLVRAYWGTAHFTTDRSKGTTTLEDIASEYSPLFNLGDINEGDLFDRLDLLLEQYAKMRDASRQVVYEGGLSRSQMEQDVTMRIIWGYFNMPGSVTSQAEVATRGKTQSQEDFREAIKQARKEFDNRRAELEAEYAEKLEKARKGDQEELAREKAKTEYLINKSNEEYLEKYRAALAKAEETMSAAEQAKAEANVQLQNAMDRINDMQDKMREEIEKRVDEYKKTLENMLKGMVSNDEATQRAREAVRKRLEEMKATQHRKNLRDTVVRQLGRMEQALLKPTDKKHIPEVYRKGIIKALQTVDTSSLRKQDSQRSIAFRELQAILTQMDQEDPLAVIDPNLQVSLDNLGRVADGKKLMDMTTDQLQEMSDVLAAMQRMMDNYDQMLTDRNKSIAKTFTDRIRELAEGADPRKLPKNGLARAIRDQVEGSLLDPKRWTQWLGRATHRDIGDGVWHVLRGGLDQQIRDVREAERLMGEIMQGVNKGKMREMYGKGAKTLTLHTMQGDVQLTVGQVMEMYMGLKRGQYADHLLGVKTPQGRAGGGITIGETQTADGTQRQVRPVHVTEQQVQEVIAQLSQEQKDLADRMRQILDWCSKIGNETSMAMYGYNKYKEKNYFPIHVDSNYNSQTINQDFSNPIYRLKNQGFTKQLVEKANAPIRIGNIFDTVTDHVVQMINYHAWVMPVMDMTRILNNRNMEEYTDESGETHERLVSTTSEDLEVLMGSNAKGYALQLLKDINGIAQDEIEKKGLGGLTKGLARFKAAAVSYNLSTAAKQPWSIVRGFEVIPSHYFLPGRVKGCDESITDLMMEYAPIYAWKQYGNFTMETGKSVQAILLPQTAKAPDAFSEFGMKLAGMADNMTWRNIWRAAEKMTAARNKDLTPGTPEFYRQAAQYFDECIDQTQVVDSILHRTQIMRGKGLLTKSVTSFMGEPLKTFNTFMDKARALADENTPENRKAMARTATVYLASAGVQAIVASVISALRHMGDDEPTKDKIMRYLLGFGNEEEWNDANVWDKIWGVYTSYLGSEISLITKVPVLRDAIEIAQGFAVERSDMSVWQDLYDNGTKLWKALMGQGGIALTKAISQFGGTLANTLGIPVGNLLNELWHVNNWIPRGLQEAFGLDTMEWQYFVMQQSKKMGATTTLEDYVLLMMKAEESGRQDLYDQIYKDLIDSGAKQETLDKRLQGKAAAELGVDQVSQANLAGAYIEALRAGDDAKAEELKKTYLMAYDEKGWTTALTQQVRQMQEVADANARRRAGDISAAQEVIGDLRALGIPEDAIIKGFASEYGAQRDKAGNVDKWGSGTNPMGDLMDSTEHAADIGIWTYTDLSAVITEGNMDDAQLLVGYLRGQGKEDKTIRSGLTGKIKEYYQTHADERPQLKRMLLSLGIGYTEKTIDGWVK